MWATAVTSLQEWGWGRETHFGGSEPDRGGGVLEAHCPDENRGPRSHSLSGGLSGRVRPGLLLTLPSLDS